jgi:hypothetical protein
MSRSRAILRKFFSLKSFYSKFECHGRSRSSNSQFSTVRADLLFFS